MQTVAPRGAGERGTLGGVDATSHRPWQLSLCSASQSRNRGPNRLIGKGGRRIMHGAVTLRELSIRS
jgi:hypothetical protein